MLSDRSLDGLPTYDPQSLSRKQIKILVYLFKKEHAAVIINKISKRDQDLMALVKKTGESKIKIGSILAELDKLGVIDGYYSIEDQTSKTVAKKKFTINHEILPLLEVYAPLLKRM